MKIKILCTLGPASLNAEIIRRLDDRKVDLFRINLSHTELESLAQILEFVGSVTSTPICLDTEGAQVRCGKVSGAVLLEEGTSVHLTAEAVVGTDRRLTLWPATTFSMLRIGSVLGVDFDGALMEVIETGEGQATAVVIEPGRIRSNRAVTLAPPPKLPALSETDREAIGIAARLGVSYFALSFAADPGDVALMRQLAPSGAHIMSKIESRAGVRNMDGIIEASDSIIIDRGDLGREIPFEYVPYYQKVIARRANRWNRPVYVATNLLESMVTNRRPTIAEANDIANTLLDGVHGLVLAAETAVGIDPVGSVDKVISAIEAFDRTNEGQLLEEDRIPT